MKSVRGGIGNLAVGNISGRYLGLDGSDLGHLRLVGQLRASLGRHRSGASPDREHRQTDHGTAP